MVKDVVNGREYGTLILLQIWLIIEMVNRIMVISSVLTEDGAEKLRCMTIDTMTFFVSNAYIYIYVLQL